MAAALILAAALVAALAAATPAAPADPAAVLAAERAFAADGAAMGVRDSFVKHAVPDAVMIAAEPTTVSALYGAQPPGKPKDEPLLAWWPAFAGVSRSGDFGFTTGPVEVGGQRAGHYFTVWKRQPDGAWKWIYDGGTNAPSKDEPAPGADLVWTYGRAVSEAGKGHYVHVWQRREAGWKLAFAQVIPPPPPPKPPQS